MDFTSLAVFCHGFKSIVTKATNKARTMVTISDTKLTGYLFSTATMFRHERHYDQSIHSINKNAVKLSVSMSAINYYPTHSSMLF